MSDVETVVYVLAIPAGLVVAGVKFWNSPLSIPPGLALQREREKYLLGGILLMIFGGIQGIIAVYLVLLTELTRQRKKRAAGRPLALPLFPSVALSELLGMAIAFSGFPIMVFGTETDPNNTTGMLWAMACGALTFPLCWLAAYNRLNSAGVPQGFARTAYLALFPLMVFACAFQPITLAFCYGGKGKIPWVQLGVGVAVVVAESWASYKARLAADLMREVTSKDKV
jgi:hypothetical protein